MKGLERFDYYLKKVQELLDKSKAEVNPGWWLFNNDLRTPMFMLEALSKLYSKLHDKEIFNKLQDRFKQLEDVLGDIDYYNEYEGEYQKNKEISPEVLTYFGNKKEKHINALNEFLTDKKWIGNEVSRIEKIRKKLIEVNWLSEYEEMIQIKDFYAQAIESIKAFYITTNGAFTEMEEQVHEMRRKLRWLSIYPQALRGSIQLSDKVSSEPYMQKYLVPEIVNSPYNKLPEPIGCEYVLLLEKNYFLSLSWLISELGKLKDLGLGLIILEEAFKNNRDNDNIAALQAHEAASKISLENYLSKASQLTKAFIEEGNLDKLVGEVEEKGEVIRP